MGITDYMKPVNIFREGFRPIQVGLLESATETVLDPHTQNSFALATQQTLDFRRLLSYIKRFKK